jgi:hypothetical protein
MNILNDAWLAGFADGEGCFAAYRAKHSGGRIYIQPRFIILLRADDLEVLEQLRDAIGGTIRFNRTPREHPAAVWEVRDKAALNRLVAYFDRFPLRAKKGRDFLIWRRIVRLYIARGGTADLDERDTLRLALVDGRAYDAVPSQVPPQPSGRSAQLRLVA